MDSLKEHLSADDLLALVKTTQDLAARVDLAGLLRDILHKAAGLTDSPEGSVLLYNPERESLYFAQAIGEKADSLLARFGLDAEEQVPLDGSKAGGVFRSGESIVEESVADDPDHFKGVDARTRHRTRSMICVRLTAAGEPLGAIQLLNKRSGAYTPRDLALLEQFAAQAAIALRNAQLFDALLAHMGLYSSREAGGGVDELLRLLKAPPRTERLTVMFADMRGFRALCQAVDTPEDALRLLGQFLTLLSELVLKHGGIVNKFIGDGLMALFRRDDHAARAVKCAFAIVEGFAELRRKWDSEASVQLDFLDVGLGVTTDSVILGTVGGAKVRDFTAIGNAVNLAAAFMHAARGGRHILADQPTYMAVKEMVAEVEGPITFDLRHPEQQGGKKYKQYHLKRLSPAYRPRVFVSHSHKDRAWVERELVAALAALGVDTWYSRSDIEGGESWVRAITSGFEASDWVVVVISANAAESRWVREEVEMAAARNKFKGRIIPVMTDETALDAVSPFLLHLHALDARGQAGVAAEVEKLVRAR
jgi:adenylate cyclase